MHAAARQPIRVLVVDDSEVFQQTLELVLGLESDVEVVGAVGDGSRAVAACLSLEPDVVLMDVRLPGLDGVEATAALRDACPEVAVIGLTASAGARELEQLAAAGAVACLRKDQELHAIVATIRAAAATRRGAGGAHA